MAVYAINGTRYKLPDDLTGQELEETLMYLSELPANSPAQPSAQPYTPFGEVRKDVDPDSLKEDRAWLEAARIVYELNEGQTWQGSDEELSAWALNFMGWFNHNLAKMGLETAQLQRATQRQKGAFLHLMDQYDELNFSLGGAWRFIKGTALDPTTYVGAATVLGLFGRGAAKQVTKAGLRETLRSSLRTGVIAGIDSAIISATEDSMRQSIEVMAGRREEINNWRVAGAGAVGGTVGLVAGTLVDSLARGIATKFRRGDRELGSEVEDLGPVEVPPAPERLDALPGPQDKRLPAPKDDPADAAARATGDALPQPPRSEAPRTKELIEEAADVNVLPRQVEGEVLSRHVDNAGRELEPRLGIAGRPTPVEGEATLSRTLEHLRKPTKETPFPYQRHRVADVRAFAKALADDLRDLHYTQIEDVIEQLRTDKLTAAEWVSFSHSATMALDAVTEDLVNITKEIRKTRDPIKLAELTRRQDELRKQRAVLQQVDRPIASEFGLGMRMRQEGTPESRKLDTEELERQGMSKAEADDELVRTFERELENQRVKQIEQQYEQQIRTALARGDMAEAAGLTVAKQDEIGALAELAAGMNAGFWRKFVELSISNVFSVTTLMINVVPTMAKALYRPVLDAVVNNPFEAATRREMVATYSAMRGAVAGAWKASQAAFRYEQAILTRDPMRIVEGELAIKGQYAGIIRLFPRLLNASDEFMSRVVYEGFIAGRRAGEAYEQGFEQGLRGHELDAFVKSEVKKALENAYEINDFQDRVAVVLKKGVNLGYSGRRLQQYVRQEIARMGDEIRHATDQGGLNYVREALYKTPFGSTANNRTPTGSRFFRALDAYEDFASHTGLMYEQWANRWPVIRILGQLFFRTPVRVFEEGMRLTPGVQFITPGFLNDLLGRHGRQAQVRAQGEALMSMAFTGTILSLYAQGKITGDGAYTDWRQRQNRTDSDLPEPYTLKLEDGSTWSFRNMDPLATPMKIIVNAMERWEALETRRQQGELVNKTEWEKAVAAIAVGAGAAAQAFRDANLMAGLDTGMELIEAAMDPEQKEGALIRFIGEKLRALVPNTLHKADRFLDPTLDNPLTFEQVVTSKLLGSFPGVDKTGVPKAYDALGNVRQMNDRGVLFNIFSTSTIEERQKGRSEMELDVLRKLDYVSKQTGATFAAPTKHRLMGNTDLRKTMTADGQETLYDRWMRYYRELEPEVGLSIILNSGLPVGTMSINAATVNEVQSYINALRDAAFARLMAEETGVAEAVIQNFIRKSEVQAGLWDQ